MLKPLKKPAALPPLIKDKLKDEWRSVGVAEKPPGCSACKYSTIGTGFCGDDNPVGKRLAILCAAISLTGGMDDASPGDWIVTFIVHVAIWPYTLRRLVNDAILLD